MPLKEGENTNEIAIKVAKMLHVSLSSDQISTSSRIYTGDFFASDFLIKMDLAKLRLLNGGFDHDNWDLTDGNN